MKMETKPCTEANVLAMQHCSESNMITNQIAGFTKQTNQIAGFSRRKHYAQCHSGKHNVTLADLTFNY
jgi:hypothetical protein